jgi:hypothetical protein
VDETAGSPPTFDSDIETEVKELLGLFDLPAFARRGQDLEITLQRLHERCRLTRGQMLEMVRLRLRQWSRAVTGPDAQSAVFTRSIEPLWPLSAAEAPKWARSPAPTRRQRQIAADLIAAVLRFNRRWAQYLDRLSLEPTNNVIDQYNRYYVLEKECVMGSARLAARHFTPVPAITTSALLNDHPTLPVPALLDRASTELPNLRPNPDNTRVDWTR